MISKSGDLRGGKFQTEIDFEAHGACRQQDNNKTTTSSQSTIVALPSPAGKNTPKTALK
jgi:hypothetical protein